MRARILAATGALLLDEGAVEVLRQAQERGQLRPDLDLDVTVDQLWGPFYHRLLLFPNT
ncbi:hypothetical protein GCM10027161_66500 [Microbispora hainanensis]